MDHKKKLHPNAQLLEKCFKVSEEMIVMKENVTQKLEAEGKGSQKVILAESEVRKFDTAHVRTVVRTILDHCCLVPRYEDSRLNLAEPLYCSRRASYTAEWLTQVGTPPYAEQLEEVAIFAKRIAQLATGTLPLTLNIAPAPNLIQTVINERLEKCLPLWLFRDIGNGIYILININDLPTFSLNWRPLLGPGPGSNNTEVCTAICCAESPMSDTSSVP